ncbi:transposase family protein [Baaleninema simplex]|uniref:transposase family protein n=1 Tax=Baaleninema simplex TaxID=2862350 RepID=UPI004054FFA3
MCKYHGVSFTVKKCQQYFTEELDFIETGRRFTRRYEEYIYERVIASSVEQVKEKKTCLGIR